MRYCVTEEKGKSGAGRADGEVDGVIAPAGTWWRTREPCATLVGSPNPWELCTTFLVVEARVKDRLDCARRHWSKSDTLKVRFVVVHMLLLKVNGSHCGELELRVVQSVRSSSQANPEQPQLSSI